MVVVGVVAGAVAVQEREGTAMIMAKGADIAHINWYLKWEGQTHDLLP